MLRIEKQSAAQTVEPQNIPKGIRPYKGKYKWEIMMSGTRRSGTCETLTEAVEQRAAVHNALAKQNEAAEKPPAAPQYRPKPWQEKSRYCPTLRQAIEQMFRADWSNAKSAYTIKLNCNAALAFYGPDIPIDQLDTEAIDAYSAHLKAKGNSRATINRKLSVISKILTRAFEKGRIDRKPYIERQPESQGRIRFITPDEEREILGLCMKNKDYRFYHVLCTLIDTGMRCGELRKLTIYDIQPEQGTHGVVYLNETKNGTSRTIPLTERAYEALTYLAKTSKDNEKIVYESQKWIEDHWRRIRAATGKQNDPNFVPHILRHTCCTRLMQKGAPLKKVQIFMGHKDIHTTMRYTHLCPNDIFDLPGFLEK